ncbi:YaiI/YqxD family protein [Oricola sp.]|uniref:YaiI/YqxD family protein n=1 Tax=Oricola sp. TaxID=1979950 RepID=UPI0035188CF5
MTDSSDPVIYVDADACPVKEEIIRVADRHGLVVTLVSNGGLRPSRDPMIRHVVVPKSADAADDWIAEEVKEGDIVVTQDIPLAARCVEKGALVLGNSGREHTPETIGMAVAMRDLKQHLRETGEDRGYNRAFSREDRSVFLQELDRICRRSKRP